MTAYHYTVIYRFSAANATESTAQSDSVVMQVLRAASAVFGISANSPALFKTEFYVRKLAHFTIFFILGFLLSLTARTDKKATLGKCAAKALVCGLFGAAFDEWHQHFVPGRSAEVRDVCIDFFGVLTGCTLFCAMHRLFVDDSFSDRALRLDTHKADSAILRRNGK